jgi:hypothetical protein
VRRCAYEGCPKILKQRSWENPSTFARRATCGKKHGRKLASIARRQRVVIPTPTERRCAACAQPLVRKDRESLLAFAKRNNCDQKCGAVSQRLKMTTAVVVPGRRCPTCTRLLERKSGESLNRFAKRTTCGRRCGRRSWTRTADCYGAKMTLMEIAKLFGISYTGAQSRTRTGTYVAKPR